MCYGVNIKKSGLHHPDFVVYKIKNSLSRVIYRMVGTGGLEPTRDFSQRILSPLRLPIPPRPDIKLEVPARFELAITELQSIALPLG